MKALPLRAKRIFPSALKPFPGTAPGLLTRDPESLPTEIRVMAYGKDRFHEQECKDLECLDALSEEWPTLWVHVTGLANVELIEKVGEYFDLDKLVLEDILDVHHRSKLEFHEHYIFNILNIGEYGEQFESEQISFILRKNVVVVFEEERGRRFERVRERIRTGGTGKIRSNGPDYLYYALLDEVIDRYFPILESFNRQLTMLEGEILDSAGRNREMIERIHHSKTDLLLLHRAIWPISEMVGLLTRDKSPLITKPTRAYLRDCYDHAIQAAELTQFYRDTAANLLSTFLAYEGHKTNEIVKVLTVVSAIFVPLYFIAGIYGMNFEQMPLTDNPDGFYLATGFMIAVACSMLGLFVKKGWIGFIKKKRGSSAKK